MGANIFQQGMDAFDQSYARQKQFGQDRANTQAAPLVAAGNFAGAARTYGAAGMPDQARQNVVDQQTMDEKAKTDGLADNQHKADSLLKVVQGLKTVAPGQRMAALQRTIPLLQQVGIDPKAFAAADESQLTDQALDQFTATLGKAKEDYTLGPDQTRFDGGGKIEAQGVPKAPETTATYKDYETAKGQGYMGSYMDFMQFAKPQVTTVGYGGNAFDTRALTAGSGAGMTPGQLLDGIHTNFPNAVISSVGRTPAENAAAGGVANSAHLTGHAIDFTLGSEAEMAAAAEKINSSGTPGIKAIYEGPGSKHSTGPHVHVQIVAQGGPPQPLFTAPDRPVPSVLDGLSPARQAAITKAAGEGKLDILRVNRRNAPMIADALIGNPGMDVTNNHAFAQIAANAPMAQKAMMATMLPQVLENVREAGKSLNFDRVQFIGKLQAWAKGQLNDPAFIAYMSQRNDAIQTLAQVMSGVGATDMRTKMEAEAAPKTMTPEAFDAWYAGQLEALQPRIDAYKPYHVTPPAFRGGDTPAAPGAAPARPAPPGSPPRQAQIIRYDASGRRIK